MFRNLTMAFAAATALLAGVAVSSASNISEATLGETSPGPDISTAEMRRVVSDRTAIIVDTRTIAEFDAGHIPDAHLIERTSSSRLDSVAKLTNGDKAVKLVLYCNGPYCQASRAMAVELAKAGYSNVARYQLGLPVWRALGGPIAIERDGIARIIKADQTAIFIDVRSASDVAKGTLANAVNIKVDDLASAKIPDDDFNRRIVLFGMDEAQARKAADIMAKRPWHNVSYYPGSFESLRERFAGR